MLHRFMFTVVLSLITPLLILLAAYLAGGGHGSYETAIILFPWGLISIVFFSSIKLPFIILAIIQYPVYGLIIDKTLGTHNIKRAAMSIASIHLIFIMLILIFKGSNL